MIVSGVGKSGIIGKKISATLASTGTPSHFMHATEAMHGDLGRVCNRDIALLLSYSGATEEIVSLAAILDQDSIPIIGLSKSKSSRLGTLSTASLAVGDVEEACQHNLAPTASTAAMLALGDALALTVSRERSFSAADFHKRHPGGLIGKKLLPITKILRFEVGRNVALAPHSATLRAALEKAELIGRRSGALLIIDAERRLAGILTDSDLRRLLVAHGMQIMESRLESIMTHEPRFLMETDLVQDAIKLVEEIRVDEIPVVDISG
ncbi:KpsF/GutQ family sugar-phosphate isomerase, partial [bacterium]|nr:KpsF/GutQ family sugar-phosphate isomerase [bacterium]